jgi:hypothetical protein
VDAAVGDVRVEHLVNELLLLYRAQAGENLPDNQDVKMTALATDLHFTRVQIVGQQ